MTLGITTSTFTALHVLISLIALLAGAVVLVSMLRGRRARAWTDTFLVTTIATSLTGFFFHAKFGPAHVIGLISLCVLAAAVAALYVFKLAGHSRWVYVVSATTALYLNFFVGVVQAFQKIGFLHALAPTQTEPPFAIAQGTVLLAFIALGALAVRRFHPITVTQARSWSGTPVLPLR